MGSIEEDLRKDLLIFGTAITKDGERIDPRDYYREPDDEEMDALDAARLRIAHWLRAGMIETLYDGDEQKFEEDRPDFVTRWMAGSE